MNDTEKRRKKLLEQTRSLYQDDNRNPAVHPRYKVAYHHLYPENKERHGGTFGIRCICCIILFFIYFMMGSNHHTVYGINDLQIREMIAESQIPGLY